MDKNLEYKLSLKDQFSKTMQGAVNSTKKMDDGMTRLSNRLNSIGSGIAAIGLVGMMKSFGGAVIDSLKNYEYFSAGLKTMLHGDANAAAALQSQLVTLAKTTPFQLTEVQDASKQLMAYGFKAGEVVKTMTTLGDVSSGIGAPLGDIAYLYGTIKTAGRVTLMDLRQFAGRGIPIYETLAKRLNTTTKAIGKMATDGKLSFKDIEGAFSDMTKEGGQFFNLMDSQSKTVGGRLSNMGDAWEQLKVNIGKSQSGIISSTISWASSMLDQLNTVFSSVNSIGEAFAKAGIKMSLWDKISSSANIANTLLNPALADLSKGHNQRLQENLDKKVTKGGENKLSALQTDAELKKLRSQYNVAFAQKKITEKEFTESKAIINNALGKVSGLITNFDSTKGLSASAGGGLDANGEPKDKTSKSLGTGTEVTGNRPQSLNITINDGLVKEMTISTTNMSEGSQKIKEMVSKALLEAVNDVNLMER